MKNFYVLMLLIAGAAFSVNASDSGEVKEIDKSEYIVASKADALSGAIEVTDPIFHRNWGNGYNGSCNHSANPSRDVYYDVYPIYSSTGENLDISTASTGGSSDCHFTLYCDPFDPAFPLLNMTAIDDDDGPGNMPAFVPGDNYYIAANTQYYLVMTTYSSLATASYDISMGGNLAFGAVPPPPVVPLSNWAFALIGLFAVTLIFIKFRR